MKNILFFALLLVMFRLPAWSAEQWSLTIIHSNDLHGMMEPFDYPGSPDPSLPGSGPAEKDVGGLARRATLVSKLRVATSGAVTLVDAGDFFTRGPWHQNFFGAPEIEVMNRMGYDLMDVGNNEFKGKSGTDSQQVFLDRKEESRFPWIAANLAVEKTGAPVGDVTPFVIRNFNGMRVGFLGLTAPRSASYPQVEGWTISDPIVVAKAMVPVIRSQCDILIAITHLGVNPDPAKITDYVGLDNQLAAQVPGIDAIIGGDSHTFLYTPLVIESPDGRNVPIVQTGEQGIRLGKLDLVFEKQAAGALAGQWRLAKFQRVLIPVDANVAEDVGIKYYLDSVLHPVSGLKLSQWLKPIFEWI